MTKPTTYVAMDVHKKQHSIAMLLPDTKTESPEEWTVLNTAAQMHKMVRRIRKKAPGPVVICYEAGVCGFALQRQIQTEGVACMVIAPSLVPFKPGKRIRTDRIDARKLVGYLRAGMLTEVHPPDEEDESARDLVRSREAAQADLVRIRHQLSKFLLRRAIHYHDGYQWTQKHHRWLAGLRFEHKRDTTIFNDYVSEMSHREDRVAELTLAVSAMAATPRYAKQVGWLRCFRGIDTIAAATIVTELYSIERFQTPRQLMSYLGLVPSEDSSGETVRKGGITKTGNRRVRRILAEVAWHQVSRLCVSKALRKRRIGQPAWAIQLADRAMKRLHKRYWHLVNNGKPPTKAISAVSREMAGFIWSALHLKDRSPVHFRERQTRKKPDPVKRQTAAEFLSATA